MTVAESGRRAWTWVLRLGVSAIVLASTGLAVVYAREAGVIERFGIVGTWAVDCSRDPDGGNPYLVFRVSADGAATRELVMRNASLDGLFDLTGAFQVSPTRIGFNDRRRGGEASHDVVMEMVADRLRSVTSVSSTGERLIADGVLLASQRPTLTFQRCARAPTT